MVCKSVKLLLCCATIALFESSMYIFVFNWTPVLKQDSEVESLLGMIFATFMMSCMIGASICGLSGADAAKKMLCLASLLGAAALLLPSWAGMSRSLSMYNFWAFVVFEFCVGIYFPSICTFKSEAVPESHRATIYNLFRMPMNFIVITVLLINPDVIPTFRLLSGMLFVAGVIMGVVLLNPKILGEGEALPLQSEVGKKF